MTKERFKRKAEALLGKQVEVGYRIPPYCRSDEDVVEHEVVKGLLERRGYEHKWDNKKYDYVLRNYRSNGDTLVLAHVYNISYIKEVKE